MGGGRSQGLPSFLQEGFRLVVGESGQIGLDQVEKGTLERESERERESVCVRERET